MSPPPDLTKPTRETKQRRERKRERRCERRNKQKGAEKMGGARRVKSSRDAADPRPRACLALTVAAHIKDEEKRDSGVEVAMAMDATPAEQIHVAQRYRPGACGPRPDVGASVQLLCLTWGSPLLLHPPGTRVLPGAPYLKLDGFMTVRSA